MSVTRSATIWRAARWAAIKARWDRDVTYIHTGLLLVEIHGWQNVQDDVQCFDVGVNHLQIHVAWSVPRDAVLERRVVELLSPRFDQIFQRK